MTVVCSCSFTSTQAIAGTASSFGYGMVTILSIILGYSLNTCDPSAVSASGVPLLLNDSNRATVICFSVALFVLFVAMFFLVCYMSREDDHDDVEEVVKDIVQANS